jgi:hypothetical protein
MSRLCNVIPYLCLFVRCAESAPDDRMRAAARGELWAAEGKEKVGAGKNR